MYDPLPPLDSINIYEKPTLNAPSRLLPDASPLSMFFQSLLPNFNVQGGRFVAPEAVAGAEHAAPHNADANQAAGIEWDANIAHDQVLMDELRLIDDLDNGMSSASQIEQLFLTEIRSIFLFIDVFFSFSFEAAANNELNQPFIELRNSLTSVVDAMRDFLSNIRVPEMPNDADVDENESTDDGANDDYLT